MKHKNSARIKGHPTILKTTIASVFSMILCSAANAGELTKSAIQPVTTGQAISTAENKKNIFAVGERTTYIVQLDSPAVATYKGEIAGFAATNPKSIGKKKLNVKSKASKAYSNYLQKKQASFIEHSAKAIGRDVKVKYRYQHAINGVAMELTEHEANQLKRMPNVVRVMRERIEQPLTDVGPKWIGADVLWNQQGHGTNHIGGSMGEGAVIAVLDTGINHDHPAFADIGGDGYDHENPLGSGNYLPGSYCDTNPSFCNDKLIGAWNMVQDPVGDPSSPEDSDGHGSHTASTAAGNFIMPATLMAPTTELVRNISGVAPHANIIAYDVCVDGCPGSALLAAINQVIIDNSTLPNGIDALNFSISGGNDPYNDAIEIGFLNATAAGIYVAASAGNSGPGASTTGHNSPWVSTTAALTHNRKLVNALNDMTSDGSSLGNLTGAGFTNAYGPAAIVYAGNFPTANGSQNDANPSQCLDPFPAGHFNGEIVVCDRGAIARTAKGAHVLAGGAGGFVLANSEGNGESTVADAHFLPGVHLGFTDGSTLKDWMAANTNTQGTIQGAELNLDASNGDIMAGFSSRGPNLAIDVIKPDIGAPGVDILAAFNSDDTSTSPEYGIISGTSMSSPHNAGSGALVSKMTDWTPSEIKSAMMMTAKNNMIFKEGNTTPVDAFDVGAGRIQLDQVLKSGLVLSETAANFAAANPALGGDPKTLNIASMQDSNCVGACTWTRTLTNSSDKHGKWKLSVEGSAAAMSVSPKHLKLGAGESAEITVTADTSLSPGGWSFAELKLKASGADLVDLHMPIAILAANSTSSSLSKTVDKAQAVEGDVLNYQVGVTNGQVTDIINISDMLPSGVTYVDGSAIPTITGGSEISPVDVSGNLLTWSFLLDAGGLEISPSPAPYGYLPLSLFVDPSGCPSNCDDGGTVLGGLPAFSFNGETYTDVILSVNGTIEAGTSSGQAISAGNQQLPSANAPNNLMAPFWTDLNLAAGGNWYSAVLTDGVSTFIIFEWENVPFYGAANPTIGNTFQVWIQIKDGETSIFYVYADIPVIPAGLTVGVENSDGSVGDSYYFNGNGTAPNVGTDLTINATKGGTATLDFQGEITRCRSSHERKKVNEVTMTAGSTSERAIAVTTCSKK